MLRCVAVLDHWMFASGGEPSLCLDTVINGQGSEAIEMVQKGMGLAH